MNSAAEVESLKAEISKLRAVIAMMNAEAEAAIKDCQECGRFAEERIGERHCK